jgi:hypothetical protein
LRDIKYLCVYLLPQQWINVQCFKSKFNLNERMRVFISYIINETIAKEQIKEVMNDSSKFSDKHVFQVIYRETNLNLFTFINKNELPFKKLGDIIYQNGKFGTEIPGIPEFSNILLYAANQHMDHIINTSKLFKTHNENNRPTFALVFVYDLSRKDVRISQLDTIENINLIMFNIENLFMGKSFVDFYINKKDRFINK